jgi:uncharacterized membrane protein
MEPFTLSTFLYSFVFCTMIALRAVRKQSLTIDGAIVGWICGICILSSTCSRGLIYFYFYLIGSFCTKYNIYIKSQYDSTVQHQSNRNWLQVLCVSIFVTILSLYYGIKYGIDQPIIYSNKAYTQSTSIMCAIIAHHATGLGDTMASELGILVNTGGKGSHHNTKQQQQQSKTSNVRHLLSSTFLITNVYKVVPPGTNGGITIIGCLWSCCGGTIIGILTILTDYYLSNSTLVRSMVLQYAIPVIVYSTIIGFIGSCIDSILGATCQATYYDPIQKKVYHSNNKTVTKNNNIKHIVGYDILNNEQVNLVSTVITCILGGWYIGPLIISYRDSIKEEVQQ